MLWHLSSHWVRALHAGARFKIECAAISTLQKKKFFANWSCGMSMLFLVFSSLAKVWVSKSKTDFSSGNLFVKESFDVMNQVIQNYVTFWSVRSCQLCKKVSIQAFLQNWFSKCFGPFCTMMCLSVNCFRMIWSIFLAGHCLSGSMGKPLRGSREAPVAAPAVPHRLPGIAVLFGVNLATQWL